MTPYLRVGAGPVDHELVAANVHCDVERHRPVDNAVVLHSLRELVDTVGDRRDLGPHPALGVIHQLVRRLIDEPAPVPVEQLEHAALRDA